MQLYISDLEASVERPIKELKKFKKIFLKSNERTRINFEIGKKDLSFYDELNKLWKAETGEFKILIGSSSRDIHVTDTFAYIN